MRGLLPSVGHMFKKGLVSQTVSRNNSGSLTGWLDGQLPGLKKRFPGVTFPTGYATWLYGEQLVILAPRQISTNVLHDQEGRGSFHPST